MRLNLSEATYVKCLLIGVLRVGCFSCLTSSFYWKGTADDKKYSDFSKIKQPATGERRPSPLSAILGSLYYSILGE